MLPADLFGLQQQTNSPSPVSSDSLPEHDGLLQDESNNEDASQGKRKSRRPPSTAERRATHNAVERARRESLNGRFMELAGVLPNMANVKRPSKSVIVAKSLEFVQTAQNREQHLLSQNDSLRHEINELRARLGMAPITNSPAVQPSTNRNRKASSVASSVGAESPVISTPSSLGSFDNVPSAPPTGYSFNSAFASSFPSAPAAPLHQQQHQTPAPPAIAKTVSQPLKEGPASAPPYHRPVGPADVNYMMAMSMQQQQQQHLLNMQNMAGAPGYQHLAPWMMAHNQVTPTAVSAGGDGSWLFP